MIEEKNEKVLFFTLGIVSPSESVVESGSDSDDI